MSLHLVRQVAAGLRNSAVDDTHLSSRWGDLLETLASRLELRLAQKITPKPGNMRFSSLANQPKDHADAIRVSHEIQPSTTLYAPQDIQASSDLGHNDLLDLNRSSSGNPNRDTQFDAWSMWWDDQFSQVNLNYMPWFPTLGFMGGSEPQFSNDAADGIFESASPSH
jgi:hypothetical protein